LRFRVFNEELGEGLDASLETGMDTDEFDPQCDHLLVTDSHTDACVGTYRLQTYDMAARELGFYSATEFDLAGMPDRVISRSVEAGRACIDEKHRTIEVLHLLWRGLGLYLSRTGMRFLLGCCSLTSQDPSDGAAVYGYLSKNGHLVTGWRVLPRPGYDCLAAEMRAKRSTAPKVPRLMRAYLAQGARICGPPAIDRAFKTIDFLALLDAEELSSDDRAYYRVEG
jgi:putative hemolysin